MMRSLFSGVSGLRNHQIRMDVIGNNIANVNTHGFKTERVTFKDMISQNISGAARPQENVGGINPKQIGLGMTIGGIDKIMTQGSLQTTGKNTDLAISGEGFFVVRDGLKEYYTRAGAFSIDRDGFYVDPSNGLRVQGWMARENATGERVINTTGSLESIRIPIAQKQSAQATSRVYYESNLNQAVEIVPADATPEEITSFLTGLPATRRGHVSTINVYDAQGNTRELRLEFYKIGENNWRVQVNLDDATNVTAGAGQNQGATNTFEISFAPDGRIASITDGINVLAADQLEVQVNFNIAGNPALQSIVLDLGTAGNLNGITQYASSFSTRAREQDGYNMGYLESFLIDNSGSIVGTFTNGVKESLAQIAIANFINPAGLTKEGETKFSYSINSGNPQIGMAGDSGRGTINAGLLEMSNVDLADQFTDMIITQRGFQANSKTIMTSDQMLQELINLKR